MSNDRFCRFKLKMTMNGYTQVEGYFTVTSLTNAINEAMVALHAPTVNFDILYRALESYHLHADMVIGKTLLAYEILCVADADGSRKSEEPLPLLPGK